MFRAASGVPRRDGESSTIRRAFEPGFEFEAARAARLIRVDENSAHAWAGTRPLVLSGRPVESRVKKLKALRSRDREDSDDGSAESITNQVRVAIFILRRGNEGAEKERRGKAGVRSLESGVGTMK